MTEDPNSLIHTNIRAFYRIARDAYDEMNEDLKSNKRSKPDNEPGWIITYDSEQKSFKNALITIVFCGICLDSLLHVLMVKRKGLTVFKKYDKDRMKQLYEPKLQLLGCNDQLILEGCKHYRKVRREIVHEKAYLDNESYRVAQKEAIHAMDLLNKIIEHFNLKIA